jgi:peptide methionine sulfoxide reductase MsrB
MKLALILVSCTVSVLCPLALAFSGVSSSSRRCSSSALNTVPSNMNIPENASNRRAFLQTAVASFLVAGTSVLLPQSSQAALNVGGKIQLGDESIMVSKEHGTSKQPVQDNLMYGVSNQLADRISSYNRHFAEMGGYFESTNWEEAVLQAKGPVTFYDSVTGKPLFVAPIGRSAQDLVRESQVHGWPSFRDVEVVWDNVRVLRNSGETVSVDGTHLGHNLPDRSGNRYCINLVSIAGRPA